MAAGPRSTLAACHLFPFLLVLARPCFPVLDAEPPLLLFFFLCFSTAPLHARTSVLLTSPTACGSALPHLARRAATPRSAPRCPRPPWPSIFPARYGTPPPCSRLPVLPSRAAPRSQAQPSPLAPRCRRRGRVARAQLCPSSYRSSSSSPRASPLPACSFPPARSCLAIAASRASTPRCFPSREPQPSEAAHSRCSAAVRECASPAALYLQLLGSPFQAPPPHAAAHGAAPSPLPVLPCAVALLFFLARAHPRSVSGPLPFPHVPSRASDAAPRHRNSPRRRDSQRLVRATLNCSTSAATGRARARKARAGAGPLCRHGPLAEPGRPCTPASRRPRSGARSSRRPPVAVPLPWCSVLRMKVRRLLLQG